MAEHQDAEWDLRRHDVGMESSEPQKSESIWAQERVRGVARWLGLALFVVASWLYAASGLLAPIWGVGVLWVLWLGFLVVLIKVWRTNPWKVLATAIAAYVLWVAVMLAGEVLLDWTA